MWKAERGPRQAENRGVRIRRPVSVVAEGTNVAVTGGDVDLATPILDLAPGSEPAASPDAPAQSEDRQGEVPMTWIDDNFGAMNRGDWPRVSGYWAEDATYEKIGANRIFRGREAIVESLRSAYTLAPDIRIVITSFQQTGDRCTAEWEMSGTHTGETALPDIPAANKPFSVRGVVIARLASDGKIVMCRNYFNNADFLALLGVNPSAAGNVKLIEDLYTALSRGDIRTVLAAMDPKIEWREAENNPYQAPGEIFVGPDAVLDNVFTRLATEWDGFTVNPKAFHGVGDTVVVEGRYTGAYKATGRELDAQVTHIWRLRDGKVAAFQQYVDTAQLRYVMDAEIGDQLTYP